MIFAGTDCTGDTPFSRSCHFNLDFRESRKITKKLRNHHQRSDPVGPRFWTLFDHFFLKKFSFFPARSGEGPASRFSSYQGRLRRNPARRVNLVLSMRIIAVMVAAQLTQEQYPVGLHRRRRPFPQAPGCRSRDPRRVLSPR